MLKPLIDYVHESFEMEIALRRPQLIACLHCQKASLWALTVSTCSRFEQILILAFNNATKLTNDSRQMIHICSIAAAALAIEWHVMRLPSFEWKITTRRSELREFSRIDQSRVASNNDTKLVRLRQRPSLFLTNKKMFINVGLDISLRNW